MVGFLGILRCRFLSPALSMMMHHEHLVLCLTFRQLGLDKDPGSCQSLFTRERQFTNSVRQYYPSGMILDVTRPISLVALGSLLTV